MLHQEDQRKLLEGSLSDFVRAAWDSIDTATYQESWAIDALCEHLEALVSGQIRKLLVNFPPRCGKTLVMSVCFPAWVWAQTNRSFLTGPQVKFLCGSYNHELSLTNSNLTRRLIRSTWYQGLWGERYNFREDQNTKTKFDLSTGGSRLATSVSGSLLGVGGDIIIVDDPHNTEQAESEAEREASTRWFKELSTTRLNDPRQGAIGVIMQRLHEEDVSGMILASEWSDEWTHLCIPMHYDWRRHCVTVTGWEDPRGLLPDGTSLVALDDEGKRQAVSSEALVELDQNRDGLLMWPDRFDERHVDFMAAELGPYMCTPGESPVLMADLTMKRIDQVSPGDMVVGFSTDTGWDGKDYRRRTLKPSKVKSVTCLDADVVSIKLDSGYFVRCTSDHKWYMGKKGGRRGANDVRPLYRPAVVGRELMRVCPPGLRLLNAEEERRAGWLSGFFDGEGSVGLCHKNGTDFRPSTTIKFHQGAGRNLPLCERLEKELTYFGFDFSFSELVRSDRIVSKSQHKNRIYTLRGPTGVPLYQKFLHIVQPHKWRDRVLSGAFCNNWIQAKEKVISIIPDGREKVYALETETGNYVVWGIASANSSGRLEQSPVPDKGGIFDRDWWQTWSSTTGKTPVLHYIVASVDGAFTEKEENDPSAMTIWGVFYTEANERRICLVHAWRKHLAFSGPRNPQLPNETLEGFYRRTSKTWGLMEWCAYSCELFKVDKLLIEAKANGISAGQELQNRYGTRRWGIELCQVKGDKISRALAVQPSFSQHLIYAPNRDWAMLVIDEMANFPKGRYDDLTDSATQAIKHLRDVGQAQTDDEVEFEKGLVFRHKPQRKALYPV
jgi:predicted phage terminase large subunit-like protein